MKTNGTHEVIARIVGLGLVLVAFLATVFSSSIAGRAQAGATSPAVPAATPAMAAPAGQGAHSAAPSERQPKGTQEGIKVHGHWVIEVKNPDGTVTARREFENAVQAPGMAYLASLLAGNNSPGGLAVLLNGATTTYKTFGQGPPFTFSEAGPCVPLIAGGPGDTGGPAGGTTCMLTTGPTSSGAISYPTWACLAYQEYYNGTPGTIPPAGQTSPCSANLSVTAPTWATEVTTGSSSAQVQMTGSVTVTATAGGNVNDVETLFVTCVASASPAACTGTSSTQSGLSLTGSTPPTAVDVFTERSLDGLNGDPAAVPYSPGQTIAVTVVISFM
jgi:hypothetical protein